MRGRFAVALVLLVLAGTAAAWYVWLRARQNADAPRTSSGATAVSPAPPVAPELTLQVNGTTSAQVAPGEAVFFTVSLAGTQPDPSLRIGTSARPWSSDLRFETSDGKAFAVRLDRVGPPVEYRFGTDARTTASVSAVRSGEVLVDASRVHQIEFALSPDESGRLTAGTYDLRSVLNLPGAPTGEGRLTSNPVVITVQTAAGASPLPADEKRKLESTARFYLRLEKWEDAQRLARQLVDREGRDTGSFILLADALAGLERDHEALAAYQEALASLPQPLNESPDYVIARMAEVQARLEAAAGKKD